MKTVTMILIYVFVMMCQVCVSYAQGATWAAKDGSIRNVDARGIITSPDTIYIATRNAVYRWAAKDNSWQSVYSLPVGENEINCLGGSPSRLFIGTRRGLLRSEDCGVSWKNVFKTIIGAKSNILCINIPAEGSGKVLIGSENGIFISLNSGDKWADYSGILKNKPVIRIAVNAGSVYAATDSGLYLRIEGSEEWERVLVKSATETDSEALLPELDEAEVECASPIKCVVTHGSILYVAIEKKILYSNDGGSHWRPFPCQGLSGDVNDILLTRNGQIRYSATTKGVFEYSSKDSRWAELYRGLEKNPNVTSLSFGNENENLLWAVTDNGLYKFESGKYVPGQYIDIEKNIKTLKIMSDSEPSFRGLQKAAMDFSEVNPEKIKKWRREARMRSLVPKVSFGIDKNRSTNTEIYTSATKDYAVIGPDDFSDGWDISISWELGDMIWSDDQTNIDVRSRLTTQLRNDILDDLRRIYYERKRLQFELATIPAEDLKMRFEKEMRLEELTQALDDLTGNYFSDKMEKTGD